MAGFPDWPDDDEPRSTSAALARCWSFSLFAHWFGAATPHGAVLRSELVGRIGADLGCDLRLGHCADPVGMGRSGGRSEEHTSELQSLMRISYAVFCLKKKKHDKYIDILLSTTNNTKHYNNTIIDLNTQTMHIMQL